MGIMDLGRFRGRCAGLFPGLVFVEQSDGTEPESYETKLSKKLRMYAAKSALHVRRKSTKRIMSSDRNGLKKGNNHTKI